MSQIETKECSLLVADLWKSLKSLPFSLIGVSVRVTPKKKRNNWKKNHLYAFVETESSTSFSFGGILVRELLKEKRKNKWKQNHLYAFVETKGCLLLGSGQY